MSFTSIPRRTFLRNATLAAASVCNWPAFAGEGGKARALFDGRTLAGWHAEPRLLIGETDRRFDAVPSDQLGAEVKEAFRKRPGGAALLENKGVWEVKEGAIIGGQVPGTEAGAYLISDETFGDFDLTLEARPDFPCDTGIMVRARALGGVGFQVLVDHRKAGAIGGIYGNSVGGFRAYPFVIDGDEQEGFKVTNLRAGTAVYSAASMLLRSLAAASQSVASKPMVAVEAFVPLGLVRAMGSNQKRETAA